MKILDIHGDEDQLVPISANSTELAAATVNSAAQQRSSCCRAWDTAGTYCTNRHRY